MLKEIMNQFKSKRIQMQAIKNLLILLSIVVVCLFFIQPGCRSDKTKKRPNIVQSSGVQSQNSSETLMPLHEAALNGRTDQVLKHIERGTDVNKLDEEGRTPLMYASYNNHVEIMRLLLTRGADVNIQDKSGRTALMMAASGPFPQAVKMLLNNNANPNLTDKEEHFTAIMYAAAEGQLEVIKVLLAYKADPFLKDADGDDALTFARNNGHTDVVKLLESLKK